ncbi:MAG: slipin family protein [Desulfurococcaceae archaeon]|jgi:regulator of protease activity HflC (stomatin/prohibitin superfamily)|nr:slipin family protein [Desulfurococcaceae archaeon]
MDIATIILILLVLFIVIPLLASSIKVLKEYERGVLFRLGRLVGARGPGLFFIIPFIDSLAKVDLRVMTIDVPKQEIITRDNVSVKVDAVIYFRVEDPVKAITKVSNYMYAVSLMAQTVLRDVVGQVELDDLLTKRDEINKRIQSIIEELTAPWGVKVVAVTLKSVELPESMVRAMATQAEAERLRRARIIQAEAERQAARILAEAAQTYEENPKALRLRELQTLVEIAREKNLIIVTETSSVLGTAIAASTAVTRQGTQAGK